MSETTQSGKPRIRYFETADGWKMRTTLPRPFVLILYGASSPGKRPGTQLAFVAERAPSQPNVLRAHVRLGSRSFRKRWGRFDESRVLQSWPEFPTDQEIARVREALPINSRF